MNHRSTLLAILIVLALPCAAYADAHLQPAQGLEVILPTDWVAQESREGTVFLPLDASKYGASTRVVMLARDADATGDLFGALEHARAQATITSMSDESEAPQLAATATGFPFLYLECNVFNAEGEVERHLAFLACEPDDGPPLVVQLESDELEGFYWAAYLAGIFLESAHLDLGLIDLSRFELPASLD